MALVKLENTNGLHFINLIAEYSFGRVCEDDFRELLKGYSEHLQGKAEDALKMYRLAISYGLTYELSTSDDPLTASIWARVNAENPTLE